MLESRMTAASLLFLALGLSHVAPEEVLSRVKRSTSGSSSSSDEKINVTFSKLDPFASSSIVSFGNTIDFKAITTWPLKSSPIFLKIVMPSKNNQTAMRLCKPRISHVGSNIDLHGVNWHDHMTFNADSNHELNSAQLRLMNLTSTNKDTSSTEGLNDLVFEFSALVLNNTEAREPRQPVLFGITFDNNSSIYVAAPRFNYSDKPLADWGTPSLNLTGPSEVAVGQYGIFRGNLYLPKLSSSLTIMASVGNGSSTAPLSMCWLRLANDQGDSYDCQPRNIEITGMKNQTVAGEVRVTEMNASISNVINGKRQAGTTNRTDDTLGIELVVFFNKASTPGSVHDVHMGVNIDGSLSLNSTLSTTILKATEHTPSMTLKSTPTFSTQQHSSTVRTNEFIAIALNMTIPMPSESTYTAEFHPAQNWSSSFRLHRARVLHAGKNLGCHFNRTLNATAQPGLQPYGLLNFSNIINFGYEGKTEANRLSVEVVFENVNNSHIPNNTEFYMGVGVRHALGLWVSTLPLRFIDGNSTFKAPGLKLRQMNSDLNFYAGSQQLLWLDVNTTAGQAYDYFEMIAKAPVGQDSPLLTLCNVTVLHMGRNLVGAENIAFKYSARRKINFFDSVTMKVPRTLANVAIQNLTDSDSDDNLLRIGLVATSRVVNITEKSALHKNATLPVSVSLYMSNDTTWGAVGLWNHSSDMTVEAGNVTYSASVRDLKPGCGRTIVYEGTAVSSEGTLGTYSLRFILSNMQKFCGIRVMDRGRHLPCPCGLPEETEVAPNQFEFRQAMMTNLGVPGQASSASDNTLRYRGFAKMMCPAESYPDVFTAKYSLNGKRKHLINKPFLMDSSISLDSGSLQPEIDFRLRNDTPSVEQGVGALAVLDVFLPVNDRANFSISFATNASAAAGAVICNASVVNAGDNLPCVADHLCSKTFRQPSINGWTNVSLDFNVTENIGMSGETKNATNKMSVELTVFPLNGSESAVITAQTTFGNRSESRDLNVTFAANSSVTKIKNPKAEIILPSNKIVRIFEVRRFFLNLTMSEGVSNFNVTVRAEKPLSLHFTMAPYRWGENFCCRNNSLIRREAKPSIGDFTDKDIVEWTLGLSNTGTTHRPWWRRLAGSEDDRFDLAIDVEATDAPSNTNGMTLPFKVTVGDENLQENVTISSSADDRPYLAMRVEAVDRANGSDVDCAHNDTLRLKVSFSFDKETRADAENVQAVILMPVYLSLKSISNWTGTPPNLMSGAGVSSSLMFNYTKLHNSTMNATFVVEFEMVKNMTLLIEPGVKDIPLHYAATYKRSAKGSERTAENYRMLDAVTNVTINTTWPLKPVGLASADFPLERLTSNCGNAQDARPGATGWSCGLRPGQAHLELCFGNRTVINEVRLYKSNVTQFRLDFFDGVWKSDGIVYKATYNNGEARISIPNRMGKKFRFLPTNSSSSNPHLFNMTAEFFGESILDEKPINCSRTNYSQHEDYVPRQYIYSPSSETLFVCMEPEPGTPAHCMATNDKGSSWFHVDEEVANIGMSDATESRLLGINRDRNSTMISVDDGHSWAVIDSGTYAAAKSNSETIHAKALPFENLSTNSASDLAIGGGMFTASAKGVHHTRAGGRSTLISSWW